jgi:hypothetical protein
LRVDETEVALLSPIIELSSQVAARARAWGPVWSGDTGYT